MIARSVPVAGVETAGVSLNPLSVARNLVPDWSFASVSAGDKGIHFCRFWSEPVSPQSKENPAAVEAV